VYLQRMQASVTTWVMAKQQDVRPEMGEW